MTVAGILLIAVPIAFNVAFARLAATFDYPDVLRQGDVLKKFKAGGNALVLTWWAFALTAVAMVPLVALLSHAIADADADVLAVATPVGILAAAVQFLGLVRWPFLVPVAYVAWSLWLVPGPANTPGSRGPPPPLPAPAGRPRATSMLAPAGHRQRRR